MLNKDLDSDNAKYLLIDSLLEKGFDGEYANRQANMLFNLDGYLSRFIFTDKVIPEGNRQRLLISGCATGTEILAALRSGYTEIVGTEVWDLYCQICKKRFSNDPRVSIFHYDGEEVPPSIGTFDVVMTCHIIEHTFDPKSYFLNHLAIVRPGGYFFIEFPTRYHLRELHTGLISLEWLPIWLRSLLISMISSKLFPLQKDVKAQYITIRNTLKPVSWLQMKSWLIYEGVNVRLVAMEKPAPGVIRVVLRKAL